MRFTKIFPLVAMLLMTLAVGACGSDDASGAAKVARGGATEITITNFTFSPTPMSARVGDEITVTNNDTTAHTLTADDGSFDTGNLAAGESATITVSKAGTFKFHCDIHQYMTGVIQVRA